MAVALLAYGGRAQAQTLTWDNVHINSVSVDGDGIVFSARHLDAQAPIGYHAQTERSFECEARRRRFG